MSEARHGLRSDSVVKAWHVAVAGLIVLGAAAYHNSLSGAFVFDDFPAIRDNLTIRTLWPPSIGLSPPANSGVGGRPLANLSFALNYALGGTDVRGYHVLNLLLHLVSTLLLFGVVRRTGPLRSAVLVPPGGTRLSASLGNPRDGVALLAAAWWTAHPILTASVSYLSQRTELLMGFFYLLTLYGFSRGVEPRRRVWPAISVGACALGMLCKEVMVTAPIAVLLYDRMFVAGSFRAAWALRRGYYLALGGTWIVLGSLLTTGLSQRSVGFGLGVSSATYALTEVQAVLLYLKLALWPAPLVFDYGAVYSAGGAALVASAIALVLLLSWTVRAMRRGTAISFAAGWFFLLLAPTSSVVPVAEQPIAENRMYLPLAAIAIAGGSALSAAIGSRARVAMLLAASGLGVLTVVRNADYWSELSLWTDTVEKRPQNARANYNCGVVLLDLGRAAEATGYFERAIRLHPREPKHHNSLGNALLELGRIPEAVNRFAEAVRLQPTYARAWYNYGTALFRQGDVTRAGECFATALRHQPEFAAAHTALGNVLFQGDRPAEALVQYEAALRIDPTLADAHYNGGSACLELGRVDAAIGHFAAAARLKPNDPEIRNLQGAALLRAGRMADAIAQFEHALQLKPDYSDARDNLALARAELSRAR